MTKYELWQRYKSLLDAHGMRLLTGIYSNSTKAVIQNGIDCLECSDERLDAYMEAFKRKHPNSAENMLVNGDWKTHYFNRLYVFNAARLILWEVR